MHTQHSLKRTHPIVYIKLLYHSSHQRLLHKRHADVDPHNNKKYLVSAPSALGDHLVSPIEEHGAAPQQIEQSAHQSHLGGGETGAVELVSV